MISGGATKQCRRFPVVEITRGPDDDSSTGAWPLELIQKHIRQRGLVERFAERWQKVALMTAS
jgi:hypothetical protein